jgi:predicted kinase
LRQKEPFIWNATNVDKNRRKALVGLCTDYGARVRIVYVEPTYEKLFQQNKDREDVVPENVLERFIRRLDMPGIEECLNITYRVTD